VNSQSVNLPAWATREYAIYCHKDGERPYRVNARTYVAICDVCGVWTNLFIPKDDVTVRD
jgi:hypothetical protein